MYIVLLRDKTFRFTGKASDSEREFRSMLQEEYPTLSEAVDEALKRFEAGPQRYEPVAIYQGYVYADRRVFDSNTLADMHKNPSTIEMYMRAAAAFDKAMQLLEGR